MSAVDACFDLFKSLQRELTDFQKEIHLPENTELGSGHPGNRVFSEFFAQYRKSTWFVHKPEKMPAVVEASGGDDNPTIIFKASQACHGLIYSDFCQTLPEIVCNEGYEARWIPSPGSNVIVEAQLRIDNVRIHGFDALWIDMVNNSLIEESKVHGTEINLGNIPELQTWSGTLPHYECSVFLPWFYSRDFTEYFPMYYCGSLNEVTHVIKFKNNLERLLMCRRTDDHRPALLQDAIARVNRLEFRPEEPFLPRTYLPEMWGEYLYLSDMECAFNRCVSTPLDTMPRRNVVYYSDVVILDAREESHLDGSTSYVTISQPDPVHMISWVAKSVGSEVSKYHSNYTTHPTDAHLGRSPLKSATLQVNADVKSKLFESLPAWRTNRVYPLKHLACMPRSSGYNFWFMGAKSSSLYQQPGIMFTDGSLTVTFETDETSTRKYHLRVRVLVAKKFSFEDYPVTDDDRLARKTRIVGHRMPPS